MLELKLNVNAELTNVNFRKEFHGEAHVTAVDMNFKAQINQSLADHFCLDDEFFSDGLWRDNEDGEIVVRFPQMGAFAIGMVFENHEIKLLSPVRTDDTALLVLKERKVGKVKMHPKNGGVADISFQVQGNISDPATVGQLVTDLLGRELVLIIQPQQVDLVSEMNAEPDAATILAREQSKIAAGAKR